MRVIPGSHRIGKLPHDDTRAADNVLHRGQDASRSVDEDTAVDVVLQPGQASLHHGWLLHASRPNAADDRRIGLSVQYLVPSMRQTLTDRESATLVRGTDRFGNFRPEPDCEADFAPAAVEFQKEAERVKLWVYDHA